MKGEIEPRKSNERSGFLKLKEWGEMDDDGKRRERGFHITRKSKELCGGDESRFRGFSEKKMAKNEDGGVRCVAGE